MRNTYEAYILVKLKDGSEYVCALNRPQRQKVNKEPNIWKEQKPSYEGRVIWN